MALFGGAEGITTETVGAGILARQNGREEAELDSFPFRFCPQPHSPPSASANKQ